MIYSQLTTCSMRVSSLTRYDTSSFSSNSQPLDATKRDSFKSIRKSQTKINSRDTRIPTSSTLEHSNRRTSAQKMIGEQLLTSYPQAIGVQAGENGGVQLLVKKADKAHAPASSVQKSTFPASRSTRKYVSNDPRNLQPPKPLSTESNNPPGPTALSSTAPPSAATAPTCARPPLPVPPPSARLRSLSRRRSPLS